MAIIIEFEGKVPKIAETDFIAPTAVLLGDVEVGEGASIWFGAVLRGDMGPIRIGADCNVQDNVVVHAETNNGTVLEERVTIGHSAVLHDCWVGRSSLIGMSAVVLDGARVGPEAIVGAGAVVREGFEVPERTLAVGAPAVNRKKIEGNAAHWIERGAQDYIDLVKRYGNTWRVVE